MNWGIYIMEHKKSKWVGLLKIAVLSYCSLLGKEGIDLFVNQDDTNLRIEDMEQAVTNSKFALVETGENQVGVYRRDNGMQLTSFNITDYDLAGFDRRAIKKPEEYDKDNIRIAERIALIDGVAFRETFDCKTGKSMYFDPIESDNRNTYHALHGAGELVDFINVLSGGKLLLTNHEQMNDNGVFEIFDMEHGEIKTGTGMEIIKDYVKDMKFAKDDLTQALRNTATKEQLKVEKQVFEKDDILIGDKVDKDYVCYDKSILDYCVMDGDKLVVENPEAIHAIPKDKVIEDVLDTVEGLDVDNKDELAAQTLEFVTDESTRSSDVTRFYDFILMSQYNDGYRRKYMETMKKNLDKRINKDVERAKLDPEEFSKMDDIEKIIALQKVEADQENKLDVAVYYNGLSEKKEAKAEIK